MLDIMEGPVVINIQRITAEDDRVSLTGVGDMVTKTGKPYCNTYHFLATVRNGKLARTREYFDTELTARVFGQ
jgi:ketosteroid isomerase-like protein